MMGTQDPEIVAMGAVHDALSSLDVDARNRVLAWVMTKLNLVSTVDGNIKPVFTGSTKSGSQNLAFGTIEEFIDKKEPRGQKQQVLCLGYYLEFSKNQMAFNSDDIVTAADEARLKNFSNPGVPLKNAAYDGHLTNADSDGRRKLTAPGKKVVEALPDQEKVKNIIGSAPKRSKKKRAIKKQ